MIFFEKSDGTELQKLLDDAKTKDRETFYRSGSVYEQVKRDFHEKCYICEDDEPTSIQMEHFEPHQGDLGKKYAWENLFFSCGHCNNLKGHTIWPILNCTDPTDQVWESIEIRFTAFPKTKVEIITHPQAGKETACANTKILLDKSIAGTDTTAMKMDEAKNLRKKMNRVYKSVSEAVVRNDLDAVKTAVSASAPFAGMVRWYIKNEFPELWEKVA